MGTTWCYGMSTSFGWIQVLIIVQQRWYHARTVCHISHYQSLEIILMIGMMTLSTLKRESGIWPRLSTLKVFGSDANTPLSPWGTWVSYACTTSAEYQNKVDTEKGLQRGGSIINVASFVAKLGAATPQLACKPITLIMVVRMSW